jgi:hypothetical protein
MTDCWYVLLWSSFNCVPFYSVLPQSRQHQAGTVLRNLFPILLLKASTSTRPHRKAMILAVPAKDLGVVKLLLIIFQFYWQVMACKDKILGACTCWDALQFLFQGSNWRPFIQKQFLRAVFRRLTNLTPRRRNIKRYGGLWMCWSKYDFHLLLVRPSMASIKQVLSTCLRRTPRFICSFLLWPDSRGGFAAPGTADWVLMDFAKKMNLTWTSHGDSAFEPDFEVQALTFFQLATGHWRCNGRDSRQYPCLARSLGWACPCCWGFEYLKVGFISPTLR